MENVPLKEKKVENEDEENLRIEKEELKNLEDCLTV